MLLTALIFGPIFFVGVFSGTNLVPESIANLRMAHYWAITVGLLILAFKPTTRRWVEKFFKSPEKIFQEDSVEVVDPTQTSNDKIEPRNLAGAWFGNEKHLTWLILGFYLLVYVRSSWLAYYSFNVNAFDFSMVDYLVPSTAWGRFMSTPVCEWCDHFGKHSTPIVYAWYPLHRLFNSPFFGLTLHPLLLWLSGVVFLRILRVQVSVPIFRLALLTAYFNFYLTNRLLESQFHVESFYPLFGFLLLLGILTDRPWIFFLAALGFNSVKEDGAIYVAATAAGTYLSLRWGSLGRGSQGWLPMSSSTSAVSEQASPTEKVKSKLWPATLLTTAAISAVIFIINTKFVIPAHFAEGIHDPASYRSKYGYGVTDTLIAMAKRPLEVLTDLASGQWMKAFLPFLFLPFLSPWLLPLAAFVLIHSTAGLENMRSLNTYYAAPLLPFLFTGFVYALNRAMAVGRLTKTQVSSLILLTTVGCLTLGSGYVQFRTPHPSRFALQSLVKKIPHEQTVCVQANLLPHFDYRQNIFLFNTKCVERRPDHVVVMPSTNTYPLPKAESEQLTALLVQLGYKIQSHADFIWLTKPK